MPSAVLCRLFAQEAALGSLFTRDCGQKQRVPFVVADAFLHFDGEMRITGRAGVSQEIHARWRLSVNFPTKKWLSGAVAHRKVAPLAEALLPPQ